MNNLVDEVYFLLALVADVVVILDLVEDVEDAIEGDGVDISQEIGSIVKEPF